jgi:probable rRNA maturation factor
VKLPWKLLAKRIRMATRRIKIEVVVRGAFPPSYRPLLSRAARAAAAAIPAREWKRLRPDATASISVSVATATSITRLNHQFRGKDRPTDVLSFPAAPMPGSNFVGDVILCWAVAKKQTETFQTTPRQEVQRLVVHGVLHLFGYDHELSKAEERRMFRLQEQILRRLFTRE